MKFQLNFKTFCLAQRANRLKEIIQPPPDKSLLSSWKQKFSSGDIRQYTFAFQLLWESSFWTSRNGAEQSFFRLNRKNLAGKCVQ